MIAPRQLSEISFGSKDARFTWNGLRPGERGEILELPTFDQLDIRVIGEFAGARLEIELVDGKAYGPLTAPIRKPGSVTINAKPTHIRPSIVGGTVGTFIQCTVVTSRQ